MNKHIVKHIVKAVFKSGLMKKHIVKHIVFIEKDCVDWVLRGQCFIFGALYLVAPDQYTSTLHRETYRYRRLVGWLVIRFGGSFVVDLRTD